MTHRTAIEVLLRTRRNPSVAPGADDPVRPKKSYRTHIQRKPMEYGADMTTPSLKTPAEVSERVQDLLNRLKQARIIGE